MANPCRPQPSSCGLNRKREFGNSKNEWLPHGAKRPFHLRETWLLLIDYRSSIDWSKWLAIGVIGVKIGVTIGVNSTQRKILIDANRELILLYFRIGKVIGENQRYGSNFINLLSASLKADFPDAKGFSPRNLARMKKFYETYLDFSNLPTALAKLPWSFNGLLIDRITNAEKRAWYAEKCLENGWSFVVLDHQIDLNLFERQSDNSAKLTNFGDHLPPLQSELAQDLIKDPYIFELSGLTEKSMERDARHHMINQRTIRIRESARSDLRNLWRLRSRHRQP